MIEYFKSGEFFETIIVIIFGILFISLCNFGDKKYFKSKSGNSKWYRSSKMIIDFINTIVVVLLILLVLSINGVNVGRYVKSLGVIGIVLSFALQDILKDVIMGLAIMFEEYYKVGDVILLDGEPGKVVSFNIKTTKLFMINDESTVSVCNRNISRVGVASDWVDILVPIGYDVDLYLSRSLCKECAKRIERLRYVYSCDFLNTQELAESWINYKLRVHCLPDKKPAVMRNSNAVIQDVFYEHKQEFPLSIKVLYNMEPDNSKKSEKVTAGSVSGDQNVVVYNTESHKKKYDYEFGRGAAKSKVMKFDGTDSTLQNAVAEAERYAVSENLSNSMRLRLRLLSEELLSLTKGLSDMKDGSFYIERDGADYDICFEAGARIGKKTKAQLMEVATANSNEAYTGFSGLVSRAIDSMVQMSIDDKLGIFKSSMSAMEESIGKADDDYKWSYNIYKEKEQETSTYDENTINEDKLGQSVLTKLADDIRISVRTNRVSIRVLVKSDDE